MVGAELRNMRVIRGIRVRDLALAMGQSRIAVYAVERDPRPISINRMRRYVEGLEAVERSRSE